MSSQLEGSDRVRPVAVAGEQAPAVEPWLLALLVALVPLVGALFVHESWRTALHVVGGVLCAGGLVLLVRHERRSRRQTAGIGERR